MIVYEFKAAKLKPNQIKAIDDAILTGQFIRNKCLRHWMDNKREDGKSLNRFDLSKYCKVLADEFDFAKELNSMARQAAAERAWFSISRFYDNCKKKKLGKKGYPQFKRNSRSVEYKTSGWKLSLNRKAINFSDKKGIGRIKLKGTYDLNFYQIKEIKRVRIVRRADGYYVQFSINQSSDHPDIFPVNKAVGLDLGIKYFLADSDGGIIENPKFYRKSEKQLNRANRKKSKKFSPSLKSQRKPQSSNYHKARNRFARKHLRVSRQRQEFVKTVAYCVIQSNVWRAYVGAACALGA